MTAEQIKLEDKLSREITGFLQLQSIAAFKGDKKKKITYADFLADKMLIILAIRAGIPYSLFDLIQHYTPFTESDWAGFLDISGKSLQRYRQAGSHSFKPLHSEKIIEMAEVTKAGLDVFGDMEKLKLWLNTPNFALGKLKPIELLKDSYGKELVMGELTRINYGILA
ncbi:MAG: antitoxin Xre/MbcA/ParS toxin-binding domain-containing protein [Bacteroidia bacterium]|jgi:putative toxin-antitoxin system antitoxin component (TIGR02293 family)